MYLVYKRYILPIGWLYVTYHLLQEHQKSVHHWFNSPLLQRNLSLLRSICRRTRPTNRCLGSNPSWWQGGFLKTFLENQNITLPCCICSSHLQNFWRCVNFWGWNFWGDQSLEREAFWIFVKKYFISIIWRCHSAICKEVAVNDWKRSPAIDLGTVHSFGSQNHGDVYGLGCPHSQ